MARNVEIKARLQSFESIESRVAVLAPHGPEVIDQDDTFFPCPHGRLKLRAFPDGRGELIAYRRPDVAGPKTSDYLITPTADADGLRKTLSRALGSAGRVRKRRLLYRVGRTRVHLDRVEGLGEFLELEVVLGTHETASSGEQEAHTLLAHLGLTSECLIASAYIDLLRQAEHRETPTPRK